ncbi:MAG: hypothetical protein ACM3KE_15380 [Hyphomicrobiales bacterium]
MKEKRSQFVRMNAFREENPPPRDVGCPDYRSCLTEAAFKNYCLDCSQCAADASPDEPRHPHPKVRLHKGRKLPARLSLAG